MGDDRQTADQSQQKIPQTHFLKSEVTKPIFTKFLHNIAALVPLLMRALLL